MIDWYLWRGVLYGETVESIFPAKRVYEKRCSRENETSAEKYTLRGSNSLTGEGLAKVKIRLSGINKFVLTDSNGDYVLHTTLNGDMELIATLKEFAENSSSFMMDNGINHIINISLIPL